MTEINLSDGKYTVVNELGEGGGFKALRYGEEWRNLAGDNLVLAMFYEIEELREQVSEVERLKAERKSRYDYENYCREYAERVSDDIAEYRAVIRNLDALADSVRYRIGSQQDAEAVADEIVGIISELERKVGEIT